MSNYSQTHYQICQECQNIVNKGPWLHIYIHVLVIIKWRIYILTKLSLFIIWRKLVLTKIKQFTVCKNGTLHSCFIWPSMVSMLKTLLFIVQIILMSWQHYVVWKLATVSICESPVSFSANKIACNKQIALKFLSNFTEQLECIRRTFQRSECNRILFVTGLRFTQCVTVGTGSSLLHQHGHSQSQVIIELCMLQDSYLRSALLLKQAAHCYINMDLPKVWL